MDLRPRIKRDELIEIVKEQKEAHVAQYKEAKAKWREKMLAVAAKVVEVGDKLKSFPRALRQLGTMPKCHVREIDRVLRMLELTEDPVIELSPRDFNRLVLGEWEWAHEFYCANMMYGVTGATGPTGPTGSTGATGYSPDDDEDEEVRMIGEIVADLNADEVE